MNSRVKRAVVVACVTAVFLVLLPPRYSVLPNPLSASLSPFKLPKPSHSCPVTPPKTVYVPPSNGQFNWKDVHTNHPVGEMAQLSDAEPRTLRKIQQASEPSSTEALEKRAARQDKVKQVFQRCWHSYKSKAWLKDELAPVTGAWKNTFGGWGATLVDSLDTLWIMGMHDELEEAVAATMNISFAPDTSSMEKINMFETTIRYLGGLLSAYDVAGCKDDRLLAKAVEVGDMIYASFDTPNRMPVTRWNPRVAVAGGNQGAADNAIIAEVGSSAMELTRLSQVTGDMRYFDQAQRIADVFEQQQNRTSLPGMWPVGVNAAAADMTVGNSYTFGAMSDSAYEYLPKMFQLLSGINTAPQYEQLYRGAMDTAIRYMFFRPMVPDNADIRLSGSLTVQHGGAKVLDTRGEHLSCFVGGMLALGGRLLDLPDHVDLGRKVTDGCVWAYRNSKLGILPEIFHMKPCDSVSDCAWDEEKFKATAQPGRPLGFVSIDDPKYILRPEAIESVFYLYRISGDQRLQDAAWDMFEAIEKYTHTQLANAALSDTTRSSPPKTDSMESFWMGETLKYFYLVFSDVSLISLDDFVFNTEAHPFRRPQR